MTRPGITLWGGRRYPQWWRRLRAFFRPDAIPLRDETGLDIDPADTSALEMYRGGRGRLEIKGDGP